MHFINMHIWVRLLAQTTSVDRSAVIQMYGARELRIRGLIRTYCEGILKRPGKSNGMDHIPDGVYYTYIYIILYNIN